MDDSGHLKFCPAFGQSFERYSQLPAQMFLILYFSRKLTSVSSLDQRAVQGPVWRDGAGSAKLDLSWWLGGLV